MSDIKVKVIQFYCENVAIDRHFQSIILSCVVRYFQVGIIGGSGLDDPEILDDRREIYRETPYGKWHRTCP